MLATAQRSIRRRGLMARRRRPRRTRRPTPDTPFFEDRRAILFVRRNPNGAESAEVAEVLGMGRRTVERDVRRALDKLGALLLPLVERGHTPREAIEVVLDAMRKDKD